MKDYQYFVYILMNPSRRSLYVGVTNDINNRLNRHREGATCNHTISSTGRYNCVHLVYYEEFRWVHDAIAREKEIKGWARVKKIALIRIANPEFRFLEQDWTS